jgi:hypothetical protein
LQNFTPHEKCGIFGVYGTGSRSISSCTGIATSYQESSGIASTEGAALGSYDRGWWHSNDEDLLTLLSGFSACPGMALGGSGNSTPNQ